MRLTGMNKEFFDSYIAIFKDAVIEQYNRPFLEFRPGEKQRFAHKRDWYNNKELVASKVWLDEEEPTYFADKGGLKMKDLTNKTYAKIEDIIKGDVKCPLPLEVIPNFMGINLCSVEAISWEKQQDGQLISLTIIFKPKED